MATEAELVASLNLANTTLTSIGSEVDTITTDVTALEQQVNDLKAQLAGGQLGTDTDTAVATLQATVQALKGKVANLDTLSTPVASPVSGTSSTTTAAQSTGSPGVQS